MKKIELLSKQLFELYNLQNFNFEVIKEFILVIVINDLGFKEITDEDLIFFNEKDLTNSDISQWVFNNYN